jgi:hypothetical protein
MLKEFALDPSILGNWKDFRFFVGQFGVPQGRLISRFPANWKQMVREAAEQSAKDVEYARIEDALTRIDRVMLVRDFDYQKAHQWLRNAAEENQRRPFHAIVAAENYGSTANLLVGADLDPTNPPPLWIVPTSVQIRREPGIMAACVQSLLSQCDEVLFVDPYFGPGKRSHLEPLIQFLQAIARRGQRRKPSRIEYHAGNQDKDTVRVQQNLEQHIKPHLLAGAKFSLVRWDKEQMHNRYILTDRGGVMFGHGLDKSDGNATTHDTVSLLDDQTCAALMVDYSRTSKQLTWLNEVFSVER